MNRAQIEELGYAVMPGGIDGGAFDRLAAELGNAGLRRSRAGIRHILGYPPVASLAASDPLMSVAKSVLGEGALPFRATLFDKSPESNWLVVWHQDTALPLREKKETPGWGPWSVKDGVTYAHAPASALSKVLVLRLHLDDSASDNGPLRVLPRTHRSGILDEEAIRSLAASVQPVECLAARGGVVAMRPLILHASSKSESEQPRRVLHIEYAASRFAGEGMELAIA
jgi:ectoine hydroxylase-related dioxygenase (phytanoyl-CoA dioxygenase family)